MSSKKKKKQTLSNYKQKQNSVDTLVKYRTIITSISFKIVPAFTNYSEIWVNVLISDEISINM